jgi:hypothetical protein
VTLIIDSTGKSHQALYSQLGSSGGVLDASIQQNIDRIITFDLSNEDRLKRSNLTARSSINNDRGYLHDRLLMLRFDVWLRHKWRFGDRTYRTVDY